MQMALRALSVGELRLPNSTPRQHNKKQRAKARALALSYRLIECMLSSLLMLEPICLTAPSRVHS